MSGPFELLGLPADADERAVKRAYAQQLRVTRPDEDPEGFQRLNMAYRSALAQVQSRAQAPAAAVEDPPLQPGPAPGPAPALVPRHAALDIGKAAPAAASAIHGPAPPAFDPEAFCMQCLEQADDDDAEALETWLMARPELWSLQVKALAGRSLLARIQHEQPPMPHDCFDALLRFFDLDHALSGLDPAWVKRQRQRQGVRWEIRHKRLRDLALRLRPLGSSLAPDPKQAGWLLRQFIRPFRWPRNLMAALLPSRPKLAAYFLQCLCDRHWNDMPPEFEPRQVRFWMDAAQDKRLGTVMLALSGARSLAILLGFALLGTLFGGLRRYASSPPHANVFESVLIMTGCGAMLVAVWWLYLAVEIANLWQARSDADPGGWPWLRLAFLPLLCLLGMAAGEFMHWRVAATIILFVSIWLGIRRYRAHAGSAPIRIRSWGWWPLLTLAVPLAKATAVSGDMLLQHTTALAVLALLVWLVDLLAHRNHLRQRLAARRKQQAA